MGDRVTLDGSDHRASLEDLGRGAAVVLDDEGRADYYEYGVNCCEEGGRA